MAERTIVKKVTNAIHYSDGTIRLDNVRISFPHIGTPQEQTNDAGVKEKSYGVVAMLPKATHEAAKDLCKSVIKEIIETNDTKVAQDKWFLANGDDKEREEYEGMYLVSTSDKRNRPTARDKNGNTITPEEADDMFFGGCWANVLIRPWYFNGKAKGGKTYPKRVPAGIVAIQFVRKDEPFGEGRVNDDGVFGKVEDNEDDDDDL